ncbi:MAG: hypothetical protein ABFD64_07445 [Armatimonadota bacterium]
MGALYELLTLMVITMILKLYTWYQMRYWYSSDGFGGIATYQEEESPTVEGKMEQSNA